MLKPTRAFQQTEPTTRQPPLLILNQLLTNSGRHSMQTVQIANLVFEKTHGSKQMFMSEEFQISIGKQKISLNN